MTTDREILIKINADAQEAVAGINRARTEIDAFEKSIQRFKDTNRQNTKEFQNLTNDLERQKKDIVELEALLDTLQATNTTSISNNKELTALLDVQLKSQSDYATQTDLLIKLKEKLVTSDTNYQENLDLINKKLAENKVWTDNWEQSTKVVGASLEDNKKHFTESFNAINIFNGGISGFVSRAQKADGVGKLFKASMEGMKEGIKGMGTAINSNPIGVLLAILGPIIQKLITFTPVTRAVEQAMAALSPVLNLVTKPLQWLAQGIGVIIEGFTTLVGSMSNSAKEAGNLAKAEQELNTQKAIQESANETAKQQADALIKKSQDQTKSIEDRCQALEDAAKTEQDNFNKNKAIADESYRIEQQKLVQAKQLSDEELALLENGTEAEVHALMETRNISTEELQTLQKAHVEKMKMVDAEINMKEQQAKRQEQFEKEIEDREKKAVDDAIKRHKEQLALYSAENDGRLKTLDQRIAFENSYAQRSMGILTEELKAKKISQEQYSTQVLNIEKQREANIKKLKQDAAQDAIALQQLQLQKYIDQEDLKEHTLDEELKKINEVANRKKEIAEAEFKASAMGEADRLKREHQLNEINKESMAQAAQATVDNAEARLQLYLKEADAAKLSQDKITEETIKADRERLEFIKKTKLDELAASSTVSADTIQQKRQTNAELTTEELAYLNQKQQIENEFATANKTLEEQERAQKAAQTAADFEINRANAANEFEQQRLDEQARHEQRLQDLKTQLDNNLLTEKQYEDLKLQEKARHADEEKKINQAVIDAKLSLAQGWLSNLSAILGKESAAGKAVAVAQATIDTYKSAVSAYAAGMSLGGPVGLVMEPVAAGLAVAAGLQNIKKITSTKTPKAEKGALFSIGGKRHSAGGTLFTGADGTQFEAERGELIGVMNRNAASHFMAFNNAFPAGGGSGPNYFASGGIVSREVAQKGLNVDELAAKIAQANSAIPAPVVAVQDIVAQGNSYVQVRNSANF